MARALIVLIFVALAAAGYLIFNNYQSVYKVLPGDVNQPAQVGEYDTWRPFSSDDGAFSVLFPALPQRAEDSLPDPDSGEVRKYDMYVAEKNNGSIFMVSLITYSENEELSAAMLLKTVKDEMVAAHPANKLISSETGTFEGHPAIDFSIENPDAHIDGKAFIVGRTLYLLTHVAKRDQYRRDEFDHFLHSFKLASTGDGKQVHSMGGK